jgi:hypothetical protein
MSSVFASSLAAHLPLPFLNAGAACDLYDVDSGAGGSGGGSGGGYEDGDSAGCMALYSWYVLVLALVGVPLACLELYDMQTLAVGLALVRVAAVVVM